MQGILPPGFPAAARAVALAGGLVLIWVSRGLARGRRRAWQLAAAAVVVSAAAHLAKGLDFEEASASLLVLGALWRTRRHFSVPGDPATVRPLVRAFAVLVPLLVLLRFAEIREAERVSEALGVIAAGAAGWALVLWLRPLASRTHGSRERAAAERLVREHGTDSLCYFALRHDRSWFFSPSGSSFLSYRALGGIALVAGDPVGEPEEHAALLSSFRRHAEAHGWRVAVAGASEAGRSGWAALGFRSMYLGDEAVVRPDSFDLEGRAIRKVRQSVNRLHKAGYRFEVIAAPDAPPALRDQLRDVSLEWRGSRPERGFAMAMDALFAYPDTRLALASDASGRVGGFLQLVPAPAAASLSLASMRRRREAPNGLMEFLIAETLAWAGREGVEELSLNFAVLGSTHSRPLRWLLLRLDRLFQLERLRRFNDKFHPVWRPRYLCVERWGDLPAVAFAYLQAESLLTPPGPWARTPDLAAR